MEYFVEGEEPSYCESHSSVKVCKESGLIATDNCPETYYFSFAPEKERNPSWHTDGSLSSAPSETCNIHTSPVTNVDPNNGKQTPVTTTDVTVPDVAGLSEAEARKKLAGFTVVVKRRNSSDVAKGIAIETDPKAGSLVEKNSTRSIHLIISDGPKENPKPDNPGDEGQNKIDPEPNTP